MGILEKWTHSEEIKQLQEEAQKTYDEAKLSMETQRDKTSQSFEKLGDLKVKAWANDIDAFLDAFKSFKDVETTSLIDCGFEHVANIDESQMIIDMQQGSLTAKEIIKVGAASLGAGALAGIASYGGVMMFGHTSTGVAIASLKGAAKTNAALSWFGGGAKAAGALGKTGGTFVLAGIVVLPILALSSILTIAKGKEKLAEAKKLHAEACEAAEKMKILTSGMCTMERMSDQYAAFIKKLDKEFKPFIAAVKRIKSTHGSHKNEQIPFDELTPIEQRSLHVSWLLAQVYYHVLATPILTASGDTSEEAVQVLQESQEKLALITQEAYSTDDNQTTMISDYRFARKAKRMAVINIIVMCAFICMGIFNFDKYRTDSFVCFIAALFTGPVSLLIKGKTAKQCYHIRAMILILTVVLSCVAFSLHSFGA